MCLLSIIEVRELGGMMQLARERDDPLSGYDRGRDRACSSGGLGS